MRIEKRNEFSFYHADCMEVMRETPDKYYDLAVVDPPYGIGRDGSIKTTSKHGGRKAHAFKGWDNETPTEQYFNELFRVSKNQIVWGANYFTKYLPKSMGWIFWDKGQRICNSDGELAFTSFEVALRVAEYNRVELLKEGTIHPTQKPIVLYSWILSKYAKQGDKILDTHGGSMSIALAVDKANKLDNMNLSLTVIELDEEYFNAALHRFDNGQLQQTLNF
jgi:site-specific DNA-methyltransferase (adenine-specific)